jgi:DNA polymerase-3 subunit gamma/tau
MLKLMNTTRSLSYQVLARKYRPKTFAHLIGQEGLVQTLSNAIRLKRVPHAILLTGVRGVGKTTTARIIARSLNCVGLDGQSQETISPCGQCQQCHDILEDRHLDIIEMDAASRTGVDDIREITETVRYKPVAARYKVYIIDEVHMLSKHAFNALLKTLEEPPPHIKFIFATTEVERLPDTIRSRCVRFDLKQFRIDDLKELLQQIATTEGIPIEEEALFYLAQGAGGSARDGLSLLERAIGLTPDKITTEGVRSMLGLADRTQIITLLKFLIEGNPQAALSLSKSVISQGANPITLLSDLSDAIHELVLTKHAPDLRQNSIFTSENYQQLEDLAQTLSIPLMTRLWQVLQKGLSEVKQTSSAHHACDMILIRLAYLSDMPATEEIIQALRTNNSVQTPQKNPSPPTFEALLDLCALHKETALKFALINDVHIQTYDPTAAKIILQLSSQAPPDLSAQLKKKLEAWTGKAWQVTVVTDAGTPTLKQAEKQEKAALLVEAENHPLVKEVLATFPNAKIKEVKTLKYAS